MRILLFSLLITAAMAVDPGKSNEILKNIKVNPQPIRKSRQEGPASTNQAPITPNSDNFEAPSSSIRPQVPFINSSKVFQSPNQPLPGIIAQERPSGLPANVDGPTPSIGSGISSGGSQSPFNPPFPTVNQQSSLTTNLNDPSIPPSSINEPIGQSAAALSGGQDGQRPNQPQAGFLDSFGEQSQSFPNSPFQPPLPQGPGIKGQQGSQGGFGGQQQGGFGRPQQGGFGGQSQGGFNRPQQGGFGGEQQGGFGGQQQGGLGGQQQGGFGSQQQGGFGGQSQGGSSRPQQGGFGGQQQGVFGRPQQGSFSGSQQGGFGGEQPGGISGPQQGGFGGEQHGGFGGQQQDGFGGQSQGGFNRPQQGGFGGQQQGSFGGQQQFPFFPPHFSTNQAFRPSGIGGHDQGLSSPFPGSTSGSSFGQVGFNHQGFLPSGQQQRPMFPSRPQQQHPHFFTSSGQSSHSWKPKRPYRSVVKETSFAQVTKEDCLCQCINLRFQDNEGQLHGNCDTEREDGQWCYVEGGEESSCSDKQRSLSLRSHFYSYKACQTPIISSSVCRAFNIVVPGLKAPKIDNSEE